MNQPLLSAIEIEPALPAHASVIWLHGLGASGDDFVPLVPQLNLSDKVGIRFIFPHAPIMPVTINGGMNMPAWFDIYGLTLGSQVDKQGIDQSASAIEHLIMKEIERGIATDKIVIAGFSQGATMALMTGLRYLKPLAGIIALSGYLPMAEEVFQQASAANRQIPIFLAHGTRDPIVPYALGESTHHALKQANYPVNWHSYAMPHSVCEEEILAISQWLQRVF